MEGLVEATGAPRPRVGSPAVATMRSVECKLARGGCRRHPWVSDRRLGTEPRTLQSRRNVDNRTQASGRIGSSVAVSSPTSYNDQLASSADMSGTATPSRPGDECALQPLLWDGEPGGLQRQSEAPAQAESTSSVDVDCGEAAHTSLRPERTHPAFPPTAKTALRSGLPCLGPRGFASELDKKGKGRLLTW